MTELADKLTTLIRDELSNSQVNKENNSAEYLLGKNEAYSKMLSVITEFLKTIETDNPGWENQVNNIFAGVTKVNAGAQVSAQTSAAMPYTNLWYQTYNEYDKKELDTAQSYIDKDWAPDDTVDMEIYQKLGGQHKPKPYTAPEDTVKPQSINVLHSKSGSHQTTTDDEGNPQIVQFSIPSIETSSMVNYNKYFPQGAFHQQNSKVIEYDSAEDYYNYVSTSNDKYAQRERYTAKSQKVDLRKRAIDKWKAYSSVGQVLDELRGFTNYKGDIDVNGIITNKIQEQYGDDAKLVLDKDAKTMLEKVQKLITMRKSHYWTRAVKQYTSFLRRIEYNVQKNKL